MLFKLAVLSLAAASTKREPEGADNDRVKRQMSAPNATVPNMTDAAPVAAGAASAAPAPSDKPLIMRQPSSPYDDDLAAALGGLRF